MGPRAPRLAAAGIPLVAPQLFTANLGPAGKEAAGWGSVLTPGMPRTAALLGGQQQGWLLGGNIHPAICTTGSDLLE